MSSVTMLQLAEAALERRDFDEAERCYLEALADERTDTIDAARGLGVVYGRAGRHFESMVLARWALRRAREAGNVTQEAKSLGVLCTSLANIPAFDRLRVPLDELHEILKQHGLREATRMHAAATFALALHDRRFDDAAETLEHLQNVIEADPLFPDEDRVLRFFEMRMAGAQGDTAKQLAMLDELVGASDALHPERLPFHIQRAVALAAAGDVDTARSIARRALERLHDDQDAHFLVEVRASEGARLGRFFWKTLEDLPRARETFDLVTAAMLNRMLQLQDTLQRLDRAGVLDGADEAGVRELRRDFRDATIDMLREVSEIQRQAADQGAAAEVFDAPEIDGVLRVCAWCDSVQVPGRVWLPLGRFVPNGRAERVTHGMCEACYERERDAFQARSRV